MERPTFDVLGLLREPRLPASVATTTERGNPALATMWFVLAEDRLWFNSPDDGSRPTPFLTAARAGHDVAVMVATFDPPADVRQVRMTGPARLESRDGARVRRIYERYVPEWTEAWTAHAASTNFHLWSMSPKRGMAVAFPGLDDGSAVRWSTAAALFGLETSATID
ncbi:MAG: hypothetical protein QOI21_3308 [Actinomycetota bacterium]|jgi:hypothetical protein|nr:hypothetical protein [Actinomycetota bacterium]